MYISGIGWCFVEPQGGVLGNNNGRYIICAASQVPSTDQIADGTLLRGLGVTTETLSWAFDPYDIDDNGSLDADECGNLLSDHFGLSTHVSHENNQALDNLIAACDMDGDGRISKEDLLKAIEAGPLSDGATANVLTVDQSLVGAALLRGAKTAEQDASGQLLGSFTFCRMVPGREEREKMWRLNGVSDDANSCSLETIAQTSQLTLDMTFESQTHRSINLDGTAGGIVSTSINDVAVAFHTFDADKSGFLDRDELRAILQRSGGNDALTDEEVERVFNLVDTNGDGQISIDEFIAWSQT